MSHLLLALDLTGRRVLLVGGGRVGTRRARMFLDAGAAVVVVSPSVTAELAELAEQGAVELQRRPYAAGDLAGAWLVHTATGIDEVDARVVADSTASGTFCVDATNGIRATAHVPARRDLDGATVAVHAHGDHSRAKQLADSISAQFEKGSVSLSSQAIA